MEEVLKEKIEFFFTPPTVNPDEISERKSILYLLRRDVFTCLGKDPTSLMPIQFQARWPGIMTIMTGIDLLGQYYKGSDCPESCGIRIKNFLKDFTKLKKEERNVLFQLRNALIHSFGLFTRDSNGKEYFFTLTSIKKQKLIEKVNGKNLYVIGDEPLHHEFEEVVIKYHKELLKNTMLQRNFEAMFPHHSTVNITK